MPLKLIPPGKRKNRCYVVRGRLLGVDIETSTKTRNPADAERFKNELERELLDGIIPGANAHVTFHRAADLYVASKNPPLRKVDLRLVDRLKEAITDKPVRAVIQADIDAAARSLHPNHTPDTWNRNVYTPAAAILHYAAQNQWRDWLRVKRPKLKQPETRAVADDVAETLLNATTGKQHLLLMWLFKHGSRIGGALAVECSRVNMAAREYDLYIPKNKQWRRFPIDDQVYRLLKTDPDMKHGTGRLFPAWASANSVYRWLNILCAYHHVHFTPHMARHRLGKSIGNSHGLRVVMSALGQSSYKSALRYVAEDIDAVRAATKATKRLGNGSGKR